MNIYLIGMMGTGKTTIGKILSTIMQKVFIDLDTEIERSTGKNIDEIFDKDGEASFRILESKQLKLYSNSIIACGGGVILIEENIHFLKTHGIVILLTSKIKELSQRLNKSYRRPLLKSKNINDTLTGQWAKREKYYNEAADHLIKTDGKTPISIANEILLTVNK